MNKQQRPPISLDTFLEKVAKLHGLLDRTSYDTKLSLETRENIRWYCDWRSEQYYQQYQLSKENPVPPKKSRKTLPRKTL